MFDFAAARGSGQEGDEKEPMTTMGFLDHLEELRKRLVHSIIAVAVGFGVCWWKAEWLFGFAQRPIVDVLKKHGLPEKLVFLNPTDPFNLYLKVAALAGLFLTSPYVLYQVWMFISPGLYRNEKRYVVPFMVSTITLFVSGGYFGYRIVYPRALDFLISFGKQFQPMITITEYTQLFLSIILGMGLIFEMPILVFFLAFMGIMSPEFMIKNFRYSILIIFIIAAIVTPTPDIVNMCVFAAPMLVLYALSIGVAWLVHPKQRNARQEKQKAKQGGRQSQ
ncbi:MAG: twin-arginine translocase subunit TatC [Candidatus Sulfotelmatobacter sp.]|jgi:sec-independent protein translocase protein TatC